MFSSVDTLGKIIVSIFSFVVNAFVLNVLFVVYILIGGILLGFFPALSTLFITVRFLFKNKEKKESIIRFYNKSYFSSFWETNKIGYMYLLPGVLLVFAVIYFAPYEHIIIKIVYFITLFIFSIYLLVFPHLFMMYSHFELSFKQYLKEPLMVFFISLRENIMLVLGYIVIMLISYNYPIFIPLLFPSSFVFLTVFILLNHYDKLHENKT